MKIDDSIFAVKLYEMAERYGKMQCRIRVCEQGDEAKIHSELKKAEEELEESTLLLEEKAGSCRSEAVKILSQIQLDYRKKTQELMKKQLANDIHSKDSSPEGRQERSRTAVCGICDGFRHACSTAGTDLRSDGT